MSKQPMQQSAQAQTSDVTPVSNNQAIGANQPLVTPVRGKNTAQHEAEAQQLSGMPARPFDNDTPNNEGVDQALRGRQGEPLPDNIREDFEGRLQTSLEDVRVHRGGYATDLAQEKEAKALTYGQDIVFDEAFYSPSGAGLDRLLHEVVHTIQQRNTQPTIQRDPKPQSKTNKVLEEIKELIKQAQSSDAKKAQAALAKLNDYVKRIANYRTDLVMKGDDTSAKATERQKLLLEKVAAAKKKLDKNYAAQKTGAVPMFEKNYQIQKDALDVVGKRYAEKDFRKVLDSINDDLVKGLVAGIDDLTKLSPTLNEEMKIYDLPAMRRGVRDFVYYYRYQATVKELSIPESVQEKLKELDKAEAAKEAASTGATKPTPQKPTGQSGTTPEVQKPKDKKGTGSGEKGRGTGEKKTDPDTTGGGDKDGDGKPKSDKAGDGTGQKKSKYTKEEAQLINSFLNAIQDGDKKPDPTKPVDPKKKLDRDKVLEIMADMSAEERAQFLRDLAYFKGNNAGSGDSEKSMLERAIELKALSEADRQAMRTNEILHPDQESSTETPDSVSLMLTGDMERAEKDKSLDKLTGDIKQNDIALILDSNRSEEFDKAMKEYKEIFGEGNKGKASKIPLFNEMMMFEGLLAGAGAKNPEIAKLADKLTADMLRIRLAIQREIQYLLIELAAEAAVGALITYLSVGAGALLTAARVGKLMSRINKLYKFIKKLEGIFNVYNDVMRIVNKVKDVGNAYEQAVGVYDKYYAKYTVLMKQFNSIDADDDIEAQMEEVETKLIAELEAQLKGGKLGDILETFYLPEDLTEEDLLEVLFNMPKGVDALTEMAEYYNNKANAKSPEFTRNLALRAVQAGALLYPVVGYLAMLVGERLGGFVDNQKEWDEILFDSLSPIDLDTFAGGSGGRRRGKKRGKSSRKSKKESKKENQNRLDSSKRKKQYNDPKVNNELESRVKKGAKEMQDEYNRDGAFRLGGKKTEVWTSQWFKMNSRENVKDIRDDVPRTSIKSSKGAKVPMPRFKLKNYRVTAGQVPHVTLQLNPPADVTPGKEKVVTDDQLLKDGLEIKSSDKKKKQKIKSIEKEYNDGKSLPEIEQSSNDQDKDDKQDSTKKDKRTMQNSRPVIVKSGSTALILWRPPLPSNQLRGDTKSNPIEITWHKPPPNKYPTLQQSTAGANNTGGLREISPIKDTLVNVPDMSMQEQVASAERNYLEAKKRFEKTDEKQRQQLQTNIQTYTTEMGAIQSVRSEIQAARDALKTNSRYYAGTDRKQYTDYLGTKADHTIAIHVGIPSNKNVKAMQHAAADGYLYLKADAKGKIGRYGLDSALESHRSELYQRVRTLTDFRKADDEALVTPDELKTLEQTRDTVRQQAASGDVRSYNLRIHQPYMPNVGYTFKRIPSARKPKRRQQKIFRNMLIALNLEFADSGVKVAEAGFGFEADHVIDLTFGGPDAWENLWPLMPKHIEGGTHQAPDQRINIKTRQEVKTTTPTSDDVKKITDSKLDNKWFKIKRFP